MSKLRMCDECKTLDPNVANWLEVNPDKIVYSFTSGVESVYGDLHFCGWPCLATYAERKAEPARESVGGS